MILFVAGVGHTVIFFATSYSSIKKTVKFIKAQHVSKLLIATEYTRFPELIKNSPSL